MIKIGRKEAFYGYVNYAVTQLANIIVLPIVLNRVSTEEYALWNVFVSIQGFVILFELGFSTIIARYSTYAYCGAEEIPRKGLPFMEKNDKPNYNLLTGILNVSRTIYQKIVLLALFVLIFFTGYIIYIARNQKNIHMIIISWIIYSFGIAFSLYFTFYTSFLKGVGRIREMRILGIKVSIIQCILKVGLVLLGFGLLGIALSVVLTIIYQRLWIKHYTKEVFPQGMRYSCTTETEGQIKASLKFNARSMGVMVIAQYIENQGMTLICSGFLPLDFVARYGLTSQFIGIAGSLSTIPISTFQPKISEHRVKNETEKLRDSFSMLSVMIGCTYIVGVTLIYIFIPFALSIIRSNTMVFNDLTYILIVIYHLQLILIQWTTKFIGYGNEQPFVRSSVLTAVIGLVCGFVVLGPLQLGFNSYIIACICVEVYNTIRWPQYSRRLLGLKTSDLLLRGCKRIYLESSSIIKICLNKIRQVNR